MCDDAHETLAKGGRIIFSGCGATGRLSILLQAMWKRGCKKYERPDLCDRVEGIQTGGDFAVVRCIPSFEDFKIVGYQQAVELKVCADDMFVAITEGGETSSVLGSLDRAIEVGSKCYLLFNNPADILREHIERSRLAIENPRVSVFDLYSGQMAIAGSTRMQATSSEMLVAGTVLERAFARLVLKRECETDFYKAFERLLNSLGSDACVEAIARYIDAEAAVYLKGGVVTYYAPDYMVDIFTDTTERTPTFMLPPFQVKGHETGVEPWTFVKSLRLGTRAAYDALFERAPSCLDWKEEDYVRMGMRSFLPKELPLTGREDLYGFEIGCEAMPARWAHSESAAVLVEAGELDAGVGAADLADFEQIAQNYPHRMVLDIGGHAGDFSIPFVWEETGLGLLFRLGLKLVLNNVSTGAMVRVGRTRDNWMTYVSVSNKKLIDRAIRIISSLGGISYERACDMLFEAKAEVAAMPRARQENISMVMYVLAKLGKE